MQLHCKKCGKDVTMETELETRPPYRIINNHKCEAERLQSLQQLDIIMKDELKETLVELIENDELSTSQMEWILEYIQGNGYVKDGENG